MNPLKSRYRSFSSHPLFALVLGLLPCIAVATHFVSKKRALENLKAQVFYLHSKDKQLEKRQKLESELIEQMTGADPDYLQKQMETLTFLEEEIRRLEALVLDDKEESSAKKRLHFLKEGANSLRFREQNLQRVGKFQEVEVLLQHPVEMGSEDLQKLLCKLEHVPISSHKPDPKSPDFLINQFELIRKPLAKNEEAFVVKFQCIKREVVDE